MEEYIGVIKLFAGSFAPKRFMECNGQLLQIRNNTALFSVIGDTYGGDGKTTFALPDLTKQALVKGSRYIMCIEGIYPAKT